MHLCYACYLAYSYLASPRVRWRGGGKGAGVGRDGQDGAGRTNTKTRLEYLITLVIKQENGK